MPFTLPRPLLYAIGALVALLALYLLIDAYGDARYDKGKADTDAAWVAAGEKLEEQAAAAAKDADAPAVKRVEAWNEKVETEKERIDAATADGSSPLDALWGV
jgi:hypothetical protein